MSFIATRSAHSAPQPSSLGLSLSAGSRIRPPSGPPGFSSPRFLLLDLRDLRKEESQAEAFRKLESGS